MAGRPVVLLAVLLLSCVRGGLSMCPKRCNCSDVDVLCQDTSLKVVPHFLNPEIQTLDLSDNVLERLETGLSYYFNLRTVNLSKNRFQSIGRNQFMNQNKLISLDISWNFISKLRSGAFNGLESLDRLDLGSNLLERLENKVFTGLVNLEALDLANNKIALIEPQAFKYLKKLRVLNLQKNQLRSVGGWTAPLVGLQKLDMSQNIMDSVAGQPIKLASLQELNLSDNLISGLDVGLLAECPALVTLDTSYNKMRQVPKVGSLQNLVISGNPLRQLDQASLNSLPSLEFLEASHMPVLEAVLPLAFMYTPRLREAVLSHNQQLVPLPAGLFQTTPALVALDVSHNRWSSLARDQVPLTPSELRLSGLPLSCNCSLLWLWELARQDVLVDGAVCDGSHRLDTADVDLLACSHTDHQLVLASTLSVLSLLVLVLLMLAVARCLRSRRSEKQHCDYLQYDPRQSPQMYGTARLVKGPPVCGQLLPAGHARSPHKLADTRSETLTEQFLVTAASSGSPTGVYGEYQQPAGEPIYYSVQDQEAVLVPSPVAGRTAHGPGHLPDANLECCVPRNKSSMSPTLSARHELLYSEHSQTFYNKQKFPDVLPRRNQNQNYYV